MNRHSPSSKSALVALMVVVCSTAIARADEAPDDAAAYDRLVRRHKPRYLRAALEEGFLIGAGAAWYWIDRERQVADWDFPSIKERLTFEAWRFDTNPFPINFAWHAIDGGQYHVVGRSNDLSMWSSMGYGFLTSLVWEYGLEFREKFSINDMIVTTGAGTAVGEYFHWLSRYLESAPEPRGWHKYARWILTTTRAAHNAIDGRSRLRAGTRPDALGLSDDIWHRFFLSSGASYASAAGDVLEGDPTFALGDLRFSGELAAIPGYLAPRRMTRRFADGNISSLSGRITGGAEGIGIELRADVMLLGWHRQGHGSSWYTSATTVGLDLAYDYRRELLGPWVDRVALMHLPGLALDHHLGVGGLDSRMRLRVNPDFAGMHPAAYHPWETLHPDEEEKTVLEKHGYYYGWGATVRVEVESSLPRVSWGAVISYSRIGSQEGLDRAQEDVDFDVAAGDEILLGEGWLRVKPLGERLYLEGRYTRENRDGYVGEVESSRSLTRIGFAVGAAL